MGVMAAGVGSPLLSLLSPRWTQECDGVQICLSFPSLLLSPIKHSIVCLARGGGDGDGMGMGMACLEWE